MWQDLMYTVSTRKPLHSCDYCVERRMNAMKYKIKAFFLLLLFSVFCVVINTCQNLKLKKKFILIVDRQVDTFLYSYWINENIASTSQALANWSGLIVKKKHYFDLDRFI